jgi:hypothetical protein
MEINETNVNVNGEGVDTQVDTPEVKTYTQDEVFTSGVST